LEENSRRRYLKSGKDLERSWSLGLKQDLLEMPYSCKRVKGNKSDLNNVRCEIRGHFKNKKREYLKDKMNDPATNSKNIRDLYRGINKFKTGFQPQSNLMKDENGDLLTDSYNILNRWKN
jgi:hypothetical protein